jgi:phosphate starvation-inducible PhoH-like protein
MSTEIKTYNKEIFNNVCGTDDCNLKIIEKSLDVKITDNLIINGDNALQASEILQDLKYLYEFKSISITNVELIVKDYTQIYVPDKSDNINTPLKVINMHSRNQCNYVKAIKETDCTFAIGPYRTGKTYLAIACAIEALNDENSNIKRIVITSDDIRDNNYGNKIKNSYLFSIYDILYDLIGFEEATRLLKTNVIEVSQPELMGERVLNNAFIILNNYYYNIKEKITYMGFESKMVIIKNTYKDKYKDTYRNNNYGHSVYTNKSDSYYFLETIKKLTNKPEISLCHFYGCDIIKKHKLVQKIIKLLKIDK